MKTRLKRGILSLLPASVLMAGGCDHNSTAQNQTKDVFTQDQGDAVNGTDRRHKATHDDVLWTIFVKTGDGFCSGHLLAPELLMTAGHCLPQVGDTYLSGYSLSQGSHTDDITVTELTEIDHNLDYAIVRIKWTNGYPSQQRFPPLVATNASDVTTSSQPNSGDPVFTVGFPADELQTWGATYADGNLKSVADTTLFYNIGTINGNSGGGVWRTADHMLVTLTNGGVHTFNEAGWNTGSADDQATWNTGPALWDIYAASATLRDAFPGGTNRFPGAFTATTSAASADLWVLIGEPDPSVANTYSLYLSAPAGTTQLIYCAVVSPAACNANAAGYTVGKVAKTSGDRVIFKSSSTTTLTDRMTLSLVATDGQGNSVAARAVTVSAIVGP